MLTSTRYQISYPNPTRVDTADVPRDIGSVVTAIEKSMMYGQGTFGVRPAVGIQGRTYYASDAQTFWYDTGSAWIEWGAVHSGSILFSGSTSQLLASGQSLVNNSWIASKLAADTQYRFTVYTDGTHNWGPGGVTAVDTNLYRSSANVLKTDGSLSAVNNVIANQSGANQVAIGSLNTIVGGGPNAAGVEFGADTNLYRSAADQLKTDDALVIAQNLYLNSDSFKMFFGALNDTDLYRSSAGVLKTDGSFTAAGTIAASPYFVGSSGATQTVMGDIYLWTPGGVHAPGAVFNESYIYRVSSLALVTNASFNATNFTATATANAGYVYNPASAAGTVVYSIVQGASQPMFTLDYSGRHSWGAGGTTAADTNLYRQGVTLLQTDGSFRTNGPTGSGLFVMKSGQSVEQIGLSVDGGGAGRPRIYMGGGTAAGDVIFERYLGFSVSLNGSQPAGVFSIGPLTSGGFSGVSGDWGLQIHTTGNIPATPTGGGVLYVAAGNLTYKGPSGTVTTVAPA